MGRNQRQEEISARKLLEMEEELVHLKEQYQIKDKEKAWQRLGDRIVSRMDREQVFVNKAKYIKLAAGIGWLCGAHRFYMKQKGLGILYLLLFWTGIPFAMTLIDLMIALPKQPDEYGNILL